ncbi:MAG: DUF1418 family protein [bacterium]
MEKWKPPVGLIILDGIGALLIAVGVAEHVGAISIVPEVLKTENYTIILIVVGGMLMAPLIMSIVNRAKSQQKKK